ncbi:MAG: hypothetical protein EXQ87_13675 [Alphaproteobacteria bacterium]|nr:hypothetical protein [Alphaproteobacteria bacterium]
MTKRFEQALEAVRAMPPDRQDLLAVELLERERLLGQSAVNLTPQERAELAAAGRGEFASEAEVAARYATRGL